MLLLVFFLLQTSETSVTLDIFVSVNGAAAVAAHQQLQKKPAVAAGSVAGSAGAAAGSSAGSGQTTPMSAANSLQFNQLIGGAVAPSVLAAAGNAAAAAAAAQSGK